MTKPETLRQFEHARTVFRSYVGKPQPDSLYDQQHWAMAGVFVHFFSCFGLLLTSFRHLMLTEFLYSVYRQAEGISKRDEADFSYYALIAVAGVHHHHLLEETHYCTQHSHCTEQKLM